MSRARLGGSRRPLAFLSLAGLVLGAPCLPGLARAATFDTPTGTVTLGAGAVRAVSFEDTNVLRAMNVKVAKWNARSFLELDYSDATPEALSALVAEGKDVSIEGSRSLRIGKDSKGLVFFDKSSFDAVKGSRFEVTFWSRADGIAFTARRGPRCRKRCGESQAIHVAHRRGGASGRRMLRERDGTNAAQGRARTPTTAPRSPTACTTPRPTSARPGATASRPTAASPTGSTSATTDAA